MRVNEIFESVQGEGFHSGRAAVFVRLSGCNLKCPFCDTEHQSYKDMSEEEIVAEIAKYGAELVVITGGEPMLQLTETLVSRIHAIGRMVAIETNGTIPVPRIVDWITVSPKMAFVGEVGKPKLVFAHEVKVVFDGEHEPEDYDITSPHYYLQPCDTGDAKANKEIYKKIVEYVKNNPKWKISLQTQKILDVR